MTCAVTSVPKNTNTKKPFKRRDVVFRFDGSRKENFLRCRKEYQFRFYACMRQAHLDTESLLSNAFYDIFNIEIARNIQRFMVSLLSGLYTKLSNGKPEIHTWIFDQVNSSELGFGFKIDHQSLIICAYRNSSRP